MFENLIGNDKVKDILSRIQEPSHAYVFLGTEGIGKFLFAKEFAYKWLCTSDDIRPCGKCKSCIQFKGGNNTDFNVIEPEKDSIKINQIRELIKKTYEKPLESNKKVYIINDADKMTIPAQNALLKVLEEPPKYVMIILVGENEHLFLNTIKSRCIKVNFQKLENIELKKYIQENNKSFDERFLDIYQGSIGNIERLEGKEEGYLELEDLIKNSRRINKITFVKSCSKIVTKDNINEMLEYINILLFRFGKIELKYLDAIKYVSNASKQYEYNCNVEMILDNMFLDIYEVIK